MAANNYGTLNKSGHVRNQSNPNDEVVTVEVAVWDIPLQPPPHYISSPRGRTEEHGSYVNSLTNMFLVISTCCTFSLSFQSFTV